MDPYLFKRLIRKPWLTLCSLLVSVLLCVLIGYLSQYKGIQQQKLEDARQSYDIICIVTDRRGTKSTKLQMSNQILEFVTGDSELSKHITDLRITKQFGYSSPENGLYPIIEGYDTTPLIGVVSERCADILNPAFGGNVTYLTDNFYESDELICLVSEVFYSEIGKDTITVDITDSYVDRRQNPDYGHAEDVTFTIAGYYSGSGFDIYIPFETAMSICNTYSNMTSVDSISFIAADNTKLGEIPEDANKYFGIVDPINGLDGQYAINIQDEQFQSVITGLEQNIDRISLLLPIVIMLSLGVGFLVSLLSTRNESRTYALMRTLGINRSKLFLSVLREQLTVAITAALISLAIVRSPISIGIYLVCYTVGVCVCTVKTVKVSPTTILKEQE